MPSSAHGRLPGDEAAALCAAHGHVAVPAGVAATRLLVAALMWGWPWALAHRLYRWAAADAALSAVVLLTAGAATDPAAWPAGVLLLLLAVAGWLAFRLRMALLGAAAAWRHRHFRDAGEFSRVQLCWLVAGCGALVGLVVVAACGSLFGDAVGLACAPSG